MSIPSSPSGLPPVDRDKFRELMQRTGVARELFIPEEHARWEGDRYTLDRTTRPPLPTIKGVRLQEPDPNNPASFAERASQEDLANLLRSLAVLRGDPTFSGLVLSEEMLTGQDAAQPGCRRVLFGLKRDENFRDEAAAALECHRVLIRTFEKSGFRVRPPDPFDPSQGMRGMAQWGGSVRLEPHRRFSKKWLLALLPLLLLLLPLTCSRKKADPVVAVPPPSKDEFFGMPIETESFIILMDKSGSMQPYFDAVRKEAKRLLDSKRKKGKCFADVIVYDGMAAAALGKIEELTDANAGKLGGYLDVMQPGGGTNLRAGIDLAAKEIAEHGRKTTLLVLTDGEDNTIDALIRDKDKILEQAGKGGLVMHTTTPRLFAQGAKPDPANGYERGLQNLSRAYQGQFGPNPER